MISKENKNIAPYPTILEKVVSQISYRPNWRFYLEDMDRGQGSEGLTFRIISCGYDSYHIDRGETYLVNHYFIVPAAAYDERAWMRWILNCLIEVEQHECCEFLKIGNKRPFAPNHGPGRNPYSIIEMGTVEDAETRFTGEHKKGTQ
jgi:hypothetical protein